MHAHLTLNNRHGLQRLFAQEDTAFAVESQGDARQISGSL